MNCPKCKRIQYAPHCGNPDCKPCDSVKPPEGNKYQIYTADGEGLTCPYCGFTESVSYWETRWIESYLRSEGVHSFAELKEKRGL